jgi:hypothetical protein
MAKSKPAGESKVGLIIALAFFVITSIALGVFAYQFNSEVEGANNKVKEAKATEQKATDLLLAERKRVSMYKSLVGVDLSEDEKTVLGGVPSTDPLRAEQQELMARIRGGLQSVAAAEKLDFDPATFLLWDWPANGNLPPSPKSGSQPNRSTSLQQESLRLVSAAEKIRLQAVSAKVAAEQSNASFNAAVAEYTKAKEELEKARLETVAEKAKVVAALAAAKEAASSAYKDDTDTFRQRQANLNLEKNVLAQANEQLKNTLQDNKQTLEDLRKRDEAKKSVLPYDLPKGKIVSRRGNAVEINLGYADRLQTGVVFSVQPLDYTDKGEQSRIRQVFDPKGRPVRDREGNAVKMFQPKGSIEVVEVLGPNLAKGLITGEYDDTREPIMAEDLLYNASWQKGNSDHVVLVGIFDKDGNGTDDIRQVATELKKAGVTVDGYWDLATNKWAEGGPTERTAYVIRGEFPLVLPGAMGEGLTKEKENLRGSLSAALTQADNKGAKVISYRDYFPRVGYKVAFGLPDDTVNQAAAKYLQAALPPPDAPR